MASEPVLICVPEAEELEGCQQEKYKRVHFGDICRRYGIHREEKTESFCEIPFIDPQFVFLTHFCIILELLREISGQQVN